MGTKLGTKKRRNQNTKRHKTLKIIKNKRNREIKKTKNNKFKISPSPPRLKNRIFLRFFFFIYQKNNNYFLFGYELGTYSNFRIISVSPLGRICAYVLNKVSTVWPRYFATATGDTAFPFSLLSRGDAQECLRS